MPAPCVGRKQSGVKEEHKLLGHNERALQQWSNPETFVGHRLQPLLNCLLKGLSSYASQTPIASALFLTDGNFPRNHVARRTYQTVSCTLRLECQCTSLACAYILDFLETTCLPLQHCSPHSRCEMLSSLSCELSVSPAEIVNAEVVAIVGVAKLRQRRSPTLWII
jgi:hypothetical protein